MADVQLVIAGVLSLLAAGIHGIAGEILVVRKLTPATLTPTPFGGPSMTKAMIQATWHLATLGFLTVGVGLLLAGSVLDGDAARAVGILAAGAATAFAALVLVLGITQTDFPRSIARHPAPLVLTLTAALAWWGVL